MTINEKIKELRKKANLTQEALAAVLNISYQSVSKWEEGLCCPDVMLLPLLAEIFGVSTDTLLGSNAGEPKHIDYDRLYNGEEYYWGVDPTPFCCSILPHLPTGRRPRLLEIGCGEGRDAVFFARCGCDVSAYDISSAGKRKTEQLAARAFVNVHAFCADMISFVPRETYDVVYASRALHYVPKEMRRSFFSNYKACALPAESMHSLLSLISRIYRPRPIMTNMVI